MATTHPRLAAEFHMTRNGGLTPTDVVAGTSKRLWWKCACGNEWPATGDSRANKGRSCGRCKRLSVVGPR
ncbi:zinc-ribbon domain-containing protein [Microbacterium sp. zg.Y909]|uniref:zinc-ribbon domain-containing protein n=1 Tax=Microbacterium sp. zg.Y909 TaxID=2969413 RepID=UPI0035A81A01